MPRQKVKSRRKKKKSAGIFTIILVLTALALISAAAGRLFYYRFGPNNEYKNLNEWFEVSGDEIKLYSDGEAEHEYKGLLYEGNVYIPYEYVYQSINERFYWNESESLLSYTLPDKVLDFDSDAKLSDVADTEDNYVSGTETENPENSAEKEITAPVFITRENLTYIGLSLIEKYTNIRGTAFTAGTETAKRLFLNKGGTTVEIGHIRHNTKLRTAADKKAPILVDLKKGEQVTVTDVHENWTRIVTESGFAGYVKNSKLSYSEGTETLTYPDTYKEPEFTYSTMDKKVVLGWQAIHNLSANANLDSIYENTGGAINVIAPQWLQIDSADGGLTDFTSTEYIKKAHAMGLKVWAVVDNVNQTGGIKDFNTEEFFGDTKKRRNFIKTLVQMALDYGYDGLNIDLEAVPREAGYSYTQFFRELSVECHKNKITLSIDNYVPYSYNEHYNLNEQGVFADYVIIMGYDEHTGSDIGPVASIGYTEYGITEALKNVPKERIIEGIPLYTRVWRTNDGKVSSEAMGISKSEQYVSDNSLTLSWDEEAGSYYAETMIGTGQIQLWLEENTSLSLKVDKIRQYDIAGLAVWRLGLEPADVWKELDLNAS